MNLEALIDPLALGLLAVAVLLFPWMSIWEFRRLMRWEAEGLPDARFRHYRWIIWTEWVSAVVFTAWWFLSGRPAALLGLVPDPSGWQWLAVAAGLAASGLLVLQMVQLTGDPQRLKKLGNQFESLAAMLPRNAREQRFFDALAFTAGICEEILYRGILLAVLTPAVGLWPAVLLSSVIFGLGHLYQGIGGVARTAAVGLAFALLTVFSGSLITAIILHIVMDLANGRLLAAAVNASEEAPA